MIQEIIVHIGTGKTGSSSIQRALRKNKSLLESHKIKYLGLALEASKKIYSWQNPALIMELISMPQKRQTEEVIEVLTREIKSNTKHNRLVWSGEYIFGMDRTFVPALLAISEMGIKVTIVAYFREHASWAISAYEQWALKHKTYSGRLMSFKEYFTERPINFSRIIKPWVDNFKETISLRNFAHRGDVVNDFFKELGIEDKIFLERANEKISPEELLSRSLFNNTLATSALPQEIIDSLQLKNLDFCQGAEDWINKLLPTYDDLEWIRGSSLADFKLLNQHLVEFGEPPLQFKELSITTFKINQDRLNMILLQMVITQSMRISQLEKALGT